MPTLRISVFGIACFADGRIDDQGTPIDNFQKRILLPTDRIFNDHFPPHIPYVEIAELDFFNQPGTIPGLSDPYVRDHVMYRRFELTEHRISLQNVDTSQGWTVSDAYRYRVVQMRQILPTLDPHPKEECFYDRPPSDLISGHFDVSHGDLDIGDVDELYTSFEQDGEPIDWEPRRLAIASVLRIKVTGLYPMFRVESVHQEPGTGPLVRLKANNTGISMGNLTLRSLAPQGLENNETNEEEDFTHGFRMFYLLAADEPTNPPLPVRTAGLQIACSNTNWP